MPATPDARLVTNYPACGYPTFDSSLCAACGPLAAAISHPV